MLSSLQYFSDFDIKYNNLLEIENYKIIKIIKYKNIRCIQNILK